MSITYGPRVQACDLIHAEKYRHPNESFRDAMTRVASALSDNDDHFTSFRNILLAQRFMPGGRIQAAIGNTRTTTPYNCFVSGTIEDSFVDGGGSIMSRATQAASTMRLGGGIGYDFSTLRPRGEMIRKLQSLSSGAVSFMGIFNEVGLTTSSSGHRRGAQMGVLRVDHPDIEEFIRVKQNSVKLQGFNISVAITDDFMRAVETNSTFPLSFGGKTYRHVDARNLWDAIMRSTYDWSEPGVLFIDTINRMNNLQYCETLAATNPCGEQPLPPFGACLLGSFNLVKYLKRAGLNEQWTFDYTQFFTDIPSVVRAMDNVVDRARYPLYEQEKEALRKRRMGLGVTGVANCIEALGARYGSPRFIAIMGSILAGLRNEAYRSSARLAKEKGPFPMYDQVKFASSRFLATVVQDVRDEIEEYGIRNSHLLSIAPTGTISFAADNVSSGIEPVYDYKVRRTINAADGQRIVEIEDYGVRELGVHGVTAEFVTAEEHLDVLASASYYMDSAVSKTCNVPKDFAWNKFKDLYFTAWKRGCKGCTTHRTGNLRGSIIESVKEDAPVKDDALSCEVDPVSGRRSCE